MLSRCFAFLISAVACSILVSGQITNQVPPAPGSPEAGSSEAITRLQSSLTMLAGKSSVTDVTLTGTAERISGSDDETGSATLKALATGEESAEFTFPSGTRREIRQGSGTRREGHWSGPDGSWHAMPEHNLKAEGVWFSPALLFRQLLADKTRAFRHLGTALVEGRPLEHIQVHDGNPRIPDKAPAHIAQLMQHLTEIDLYLDPDSSLPSKLTFNEHPDKDSSKDIPVEIRFSDYRMVDGTQVPFRLQKFINGTLLLDVRVESAALNSNLPASAFTAQ
jgi:hypothetical protein